ncbi:MAG: hypothetical protein DSY50_07435 [Desulfobulbus sp.]|nr:MAG: hypothetical protein DSY50_07435 [Desulfobulbus sp.]
MKNPTQNTVLLILLGIVAALFLVAKTELMAPVMRFVMNTEQGTPLQLIGCIIAAGVALRLVFVLLNMLGKYYSGQLDAIEKEKISLQGGEKS